MQREEGAGPVNKLLPSPHPVLPPQALPRRKIQLVSSNCFAEEPEKRAKRERGSARRLVCVLAGCGGGRRSKQPAYVCAFCSVPVSRVSTHVFACPWVPVCQVSRLREHGQPGSQHPYGCPCFSCDCKPSPPPTRTPWPESAPSSGLLCLGWD